jgi:hypothetical protein
MAQTIISLAALVGSVVGNAAGDTLRGSVTYYNPGVMEATYRARLQWGHVAPCGDCVGLIALLDRAHLGRRVWLQRPGHAPEGPYLVVDCAAEKDLPRLRARGLVAEVDWPTARRWRMAGPLDGVIVYFATPIEKPVRLSARPPNDGTTHVLRGLVPRRPQVE